MRALIGPDLIRHLTVRDVEIRDTKIPGFLIRCRATGVHTYRYHFGRGLAVTLGRVGELSVSEARAAALAQQTTLSRDAVRRLAEDDSLTTREARARARESLRTRRGGRRFTWTKFVDEYEKLATGDMKSARETLRRLRVPFGRWFGDTTLGAISTFEIERWRASRRKDGINPATINRDLDALRAALNWAVRAGFLASNPAASIRRAKTDHNAPVRFLSADEETRLRSALEARDERRRKERNSANTWRRERGYEELPALAGYTDHLQPMTLLALNTGARRGELFNLRWADIDFDASILTLRGGGTKNRQTRHVPLNKEAKAVLASWKPIDAVPDHYVFPGDLGGRLTDIKSA